MELSSNVELRKKIEQKIDEIGDDYYENKGIILTESDLKCIIYGKLLEIEELGKIEETKQDGIKTHFIHTELHWYSDIAGKNYIPDITIIKPSHFIDGPKLYNFDENKGIIFELKISDNSNSLRGIKNDFYKFKKILNLNNDVFCYFVIFGRTRKEKIVDFISNIKQDNCRFIYKNAK